MDETPPQVEKPLINKYRPETWHQLVGHEDILAALSRSLNEPSHPHAFLLTGPSGVGKTTIARIIGNHLKASITEVDAASNSGVEAMRQLVELGGYIPFGADKRLLIVDEAHALSKSAFQAALKILEEPPAHLYLALATTELSRVPETIMTRCFHVALKPVRDRDIEDLLEWVCIQEGWEVPPDVLHIVCLTATGQPRKALSLLQAVHGAKDKDEVNRIISLVDAQESLGDLGQMLLSGKPWPLVKVVLQEMQDADFEQAKIGLVRYLIGAMLRSEDDKRARNIWQLIDALTFPSSSFDPKAQFYAGIGRILWS